MTATLTVTVESKHLTAVSAGGRLEDDVKSVAKSVVMQLIYGIV